MRWALSRTPISCFKGPVPQKPNKRTIEGTLLHELIECHFAKSGADRFRPRRELLQLLDIWARKNASNPRIDSKLLSNQVRIEEVLRAYYAARLLTNSEQTNLSHKRQKGTETKDGPIILNPRGSECWLKDPISKLSGRADFIEFGRIIDFKTGPPSDWHKHQLVYYGALYLAMTGLRPEALLLVYTGSNETVSVSVPTRTELETILCTMRESALAAETMILERDLVAKPQSEACEHCHVKGICDAYWAKLGDNQKISNSSSGEFSDYSPSSSATFEYGAVGIYIRDKLSGCDSALYVPSLFASKLNAKEFKLRFVNLRVSIESYKYSLSLTQGSELYVRNAIENL